MLIHYGGEPFHICDGPRCESCGKCNVCCDGYHEVVDESCVVCGGYHASSDCPEFFYDSTVDVPSSESPT